jgi:cyclomaltodextrinase / maltogenic alpha-amylase / neopullulanase
MHTLDRRTFLRLAAGTAIGSVAAACDSGAQPPALIEPTPAAPTEAAPAAPTAAAAPVRIALAGGDADVWAWQRQVTGQLVGDCAAAYLAVGDAQADLKRDGERFSALATLQEGKNTIAAVCRQPDGREERSSVQTFTVPLKRRPTAVPTIAIEADGIVLDGSASQPEQPGGTPIAEYYWSFRPDNPAALASPTAETQGEQLAGKRIVVAPPAADGEYYLSLRVVDAEGREDKGASYFVVSGGQPRIPDYDKENTAWVESAIVYGVIARKFGDPPFQAVIDKLDYLKDLGINALWFSPITNSPAGDFGYAVIDYFDVQPDLGSKDDFKKLVQQAHVRGIRVLIDFVPNHSSDEHPYFKDAQARGKQSPYYDFYDRDAAGKPTHYFDWENLPNFNYDNPEVERFMLEAFSYWVREIDVDGFRTDACWGVKERKPDYWPRWRRELKRIKPDLLLLAEASARDPYYFDNGFDVAYDWTAALGKWAWELVWDSKTLLTYNLNAALTNNKDGFHPDALIFRFLNNNDTGTRFITTHGLEMTRVAAALLLTLPGVPCVYTGDEIGAWYRPYYDEMPMAWDENKYPVLRDYYKKLIALRKQRPSLHSRQWQPLDAAPSKQVYSYLRYVDQAQQPLIVVLNFSDQELEAEIQLPEAFGALGQQRSLRDLLADEAVAIPATSPLTIPMPAWSARILSGEE